MKIHIVRENEEHIEGYQRVVINDKGVELEQFSDNECSFILASNCIDCVGRENVPELLSQIRKKMRRGSTLIIGGTDLRVFCRAVINGSISSEEANYVVSTNKSCSDLNQTISILQQMDLDISSTKIMGIRYEIEASRN